MVQPTEPHRPGRKVLYCKDNESASLVVTHNWRWLSGRDWRVAGTVENVPIERGRGSRVISTQKLPWPHLSIFQEMQKIQICM